MHFRRLSLRHKGLRRDDFYIGKSAMLGKINSKCSLSCSLWPIEQHTLYLSITSFSYLSCLWQTIGNLIKVSTIVHYFLSKICTEFVLINSKLWLNLLNSLQKILSFYPQLGLIDFQFCRKVHDISASCNSIWCCRLYQRLYLSSCIIFCQSCNFF